MCIYHIENMYFHNHANLGVIAKAVFIDGTVIMINFSSSLVPVLDKISF